MGPARATNCKTSCKKHVDPTKAAFAEFRANNRPGPVDMLNLVRLRAVAAYGDGRQASGADAYRAYARESAPIFQRLGGRQIWVAIPELTLIGPVGEPWDIAFIAQYPSVDAFVSMLRDAAYREAVKHRQAAVADSRLIRLLPSVMVQKFVPSVPDPLKRTSEPKTTLDSMDC